MTLYIIGAGMAGLLAANMLHKHDPVVLESQPSLPNNHSAVLRFRSSAVGDVLGIPFRKVQMLKTSLPWRNPVADSLAYARKNLNLYESDRSISRGVESAERWIAPPNLIEQMADGIEIRFGVNYDFARGKPKVISTIPMPALMKALDYPIQVYFRYTGGVNAVAEIEDCDAYATINVPDPGLEYSRVSVTGNKLIVEYANMADDYINYVMNLGIDKEIENEVYDAAALLGIADTDVGDITLYRQQYQKIAPIDETLRKNFIHHASSVKGVAWQLGRFATWRPGLQLDDLIHDVRLIERWMQVPTANYEMDIAHAATKN
jgi:hypothetical protein